MQSVCMYVSASTRTHSCNGRATHAHNARNRWAGHATERNSQKSGAMKTTIEERAFAVVQRVRTQYVWRGGVHFISYYISVFLVMYMQPSLQIILSFVEMLKFFISQRSKLCVFFYKLKFQLCSRYLEVCDEARRRSVALFALSRKRPYRSKILAVVAAVPRRLIRSDLTFFFFTFRLCGCDTGLT